MRNLKYRNFRKLALIWLFCLCFQIIFPVSSYALTAGPSKPEVQSFEPVATTNMVDMFTGDFNYNIPLFEIGGYPINLVYHAGVGMEDEASWVGLGWNLNPGAVTRNMRGLPDDFNGEEVEKEINIRKNFTASLSFTPKPEAIGIEKSIKGTFGVRYNNFKGVSVFNHYSFGKDLFKMGAYSLNAGLGIGIGEGLSIEPNLSINKSIEDKDGLPQTILNIGAPYNSRSGLTQLSYSLNLQKTVNKTVKGVEKVSVIGNAGSGSLITFNTPNYTPSIDYNTVSSSFSLDLGPGFEIPAINLEGSFTGSVSEISVLPYKKLKAYGYYYHQHSDNVNTILDFNREKDGTYFKTTNFLPPTVITNDIYSASAQGFGGPFRLFRSHLSYVHDNFAFNRNDETGGGFDLGSPSTPGTFKGGFNATKMNLTAKSGLWTNQNFALTSIPKKIVLAEADKAMLYEDAYFKMIGESTPDKGKYDRIMKEEPLAYKLENHILTNTLVNRKNDAVAVSNFYRNMESTEDVRDIRSTLLNPITVEDANLIDIKTESFEPGISDNNFVEGKGFVATTTLRPQERVNTIGGIKGSQIYMLEGITPSGSKYVYGLPVYNISQTDVSFNVHKDAVKNTENNIVSYVNKDVTTKKGNSSASNENGMDYYVSREKMPAYAYAYLLTSLQSPEYRDIDGNGPSDGDLGNWVKFRYTQTAGIGDNIEPYRWRFPYVRTNNPTGQAKVGQANLNLGLKTTTLDDKGNYSYGEKELWNVHSIESRDMVAVFITNEGLDRLDGLGVLDEFGTTDTNGDGVTDVPNQQVRLEKIEIYSKVDFQKNGKNAIPIKSVHFEYDYSLCLGVPNSTNGVSGKLVLKTLYFTYGTSLKGQFSKYEFDYYGSSIQYNRQNMDRWGNYKTPATGLRNDEFPYSIQDETLANDEASVFNLKSIDLPSGGRINVAYEADDYAYLQDKRASKMMKAIGTSHTKPTNINQVNTQGLLHDANHFYNYLIFDLGKLPGNVSNGKEYFHQRYLQGLEYLYFRSFLSIVKDKYEFVPGYLKFDDYGVFEGPDEKTLAYIHLRSVGYKDSDVGGNVNGIAKAGWQFARLHTPHLVFEDKNFEQGNSNATRIIKSLFGIFKTEVPRMIHGFNKHLKQTGFASKMDLSKTTFRLLDPNYSKKGGGHRVKSITMTDNWANMTESALEADLITGVQYFYKKVQKDDEGNEFLISSGVASYEPALGGDENTLKKPVFINESFLLAPSNQYYMEEPIGESYFPSANVGYSNVVVANIRNGLNQTKTATGYEVFEYFTAKDFPYRVLRNMGKQTSSHKTPLLSFFTKSSYELQSASQGYSIVLNDMHGKEKARHSYAGGLAKAPSSEELELNINDLNSRNIKTSQLYKYKVSGNGDLDNTIQYAKKYNSNSLDIGTMGVESEMVVDFRENLSEMRKLDLTGNVDVIGLFLFLVPLPSFWVSTTKDTNRFRSCVVTKVINKNGILDKVQVIENGSLIETKNLVYEEKSGRVLVTSVNNEFKRSSSDDPDHLIYQLNMPAYWSTSELGPSFSNLNVKFYAKKWIGSKIKIVDVNGNALAPITNLSVILNKGDRIISPYGTYYIYSVDNVNNEVEIIGDPPMSSEPFQCKILGSRYTNMLMSDMAVLSSLKDPSSLFYSSNSIVNIINADYYEYSSILPYCKLKHNSGVSNSTICNALNLITFFNQNKVFNIRSKYKNVEIGTALFNGTSNGFSAGYFNDIKIYNSGVISSDVNKFFWEKPSGVNSNWQPKYMSTQLYDFFSQQVFFRSPNGEIIKARDEYNREFATVYGYNKLVPVMEAQNAKYEHIGFDGFEEYKYLENLDYCINTIHFDALSPELHEYIVSDTAHTGFYSLGVMGSSYLSSTISNSIISEDCFTDFLTKLYKEPYIFEAWVSAEENKAYMTLEYLDNQNVVIDDEIHILEATSKNINGWRRIYHKIDPWLVGEVYKIRLTFVNQTGEKAYFDDLRFYPAKALVKSYVYHPQSLKLMAELDENHHATYYEYDEAWNLVRVKKETERGIVTINENRASIRLKRNGGI